MISLLRSVAMTEALDQHARAHLLRADQQEDLCFALWHPSEGTSRRTALVRDLVLPLQGERSVHGNASFTAAYFERALGHAAQQGAGLALLHSHPHGSGWQEMSSDDIGAECGHAGAVFGATSRSFVGLTVAGDDTWTGRFWERTSPRHYDRRDCSVVRVVGSRLSPHYLDKLAPRPRATEKQIRTISAWGDDAQADLVRLRVGVVGAGSVGGVIAEGLCRTGFEDVVLIDFDSIEAKNLDRLCYAGREDVGRLKVEVLAEHLRSRATAAKFNATPVVAAVYEDRGFRAALDCDVLFSCVDRPWGRYVLNLIAYAHLVPVFDGGVVVRTNRLGKLASADWRGHTAAPHHRCLQCLGQYDPANVQLEREGFLDDPAYIAGLPKGHALRARENVFAFALACGSQQLLQMLSHVVGPVGLSDPGAQLYHFVGGFMEPPMHEGCEETCQFPSLISMGDDAGIDLLGSRPDNTKLEITSSRRHGRFASFLRGLQGRLFFGE